LSDELERQDRQAASRPADRIHVQEHKKRTRVVMLLLVAVAAPVYLLRLNGVAGMVNDDAWYVLLAKSLADGTGFKLISSPIEAILPLYPPGFPAVLSPVFRAYPEFPANLWLLKSVSIAAMIGVGILTYLYFRNRQTSNEVATTAAIAVVVTPAFVFLATSTVMSECVFTFTQLAAIVVAHRSVEAEGRRATRLLIAAAVIASAAVLVRSAAAGAVVAVALWLAHQRQWRRAMVFTATVALCLLPWMAYTTAQAPTAAQRARHGGAVAYSYGEQFWMRVAGGPVAGTVSAGDLPARIRTNFVDIVARSLNGIFVPALLREPHESGEEVVVLGPVNNMGATLPAMMVSVAFAVVVFAGFIATVRRRVTLTEFFVPVAIAIVLVWPFWSFRFMLPLTPFLYFYLITGAQVLTRSPRVAPLLVLLLIGLALYDHAGYIVHAQTPDRRARIEWLARADDADRALQWIDASLPRDGMIASSNPALLFMRTGLKSVAYDDPTIQVSELRRRGIKYIVCLRPLDLPAGGADGYTVRYNAARLWVVEL
jgi:hypothetical protein